MSFTTPCFIRKNTPELREELKAIGYVASTLYSPKERYLMAFRAGLYDSTDITDHLNRIKGLGYIDCGENEELFLTIAALNDTSDHRQWFTNGKDWALYYDGAIPGFEFFGMPDSFDIDDYHKATVPELTEHFGSDINVAAK